MYTTEVRVVNGFAFNIIEMHDGYRVFIYTEDDKAIPQIQLAAEMEWPYLQELMIQPRGNNRMPGVTFKLPA